MNITTTAERDANPVEVRRWQQVPTWIRFFGWLFMLKGAFIALYFLWAVVTGHSLTYTVAGNTYEGGVFSLVPLLVFGMVWFGGVAAYGLLFGKRWGLPACFIYGYVELSHVIYNMVAGTRSLDILQLVILIIFLRTLHKLRHSW